MGVRALFDKFLFFGPPLLAQAQRKAPSASDGLKAESMGVAHHLYPSSLAGQKSEN